MISDVASSQSHQGPVDRLRNDKWELSIVTFPMNESALVTGIKAISDDDRGKHLKAMIDGFDDEDDSDLADNPALLESNDDTDDPENEGMSMLLSELKALAEQAQELAST